MGKPFFEVFPSLKLDRETHDIMEQTSVEKVSATKSRDFLRIYLYSTRLIVKDDIWATERQIKKQLFPSADMRIKIYEKFELSRQYTPEKLMDLYQESILAELREYSHVEYNAFRTAKISYPEENKVLLNVEDNCLVRSRESELVRILEKILVERCGFPVTVELEYREAKEGKYQKEDEMMLRQQVAAISKAIGYHSAGAGASDSGAFLDGGNEEELFGAGARKAGGAGAQNKTPGKIAGDAGSNSGQRGRTHRQAIKLPKQKALSQVQVL